MRRYSKIQICVFQTVCNGTAVQSIKHRMKLISAFLSPTGFTIHHLFLKTPIRLSSSRPHGVRSFGATRREWNWLSSSHQYQDWLRDSFYHFFPWKSNGWPCLKDSGMAFNKCDIICRPFLPPGRPKTCSVLAIMWRAAREMQNRTKNGLVTLKKIGFCSPMSKSDRPPSL